jgi:hypothetical protein
VRRRISTEDRRIAHVTVPEQFNGPPASANGGYTCGLVAAAIGPSATVSLTQPTPLDVPLTRRRDDDGVVRLRHGDLTLAEGRPAGPSLEVPEPPAFEEAVRAAHSFVGGRPGHHAYPTCFVCGPLRDDGLFIFPGPVGEDGLLASPWLPTPQLASNGCVDPLYVWAALDCPSGFACIPLGSRTLLATMAATIDAPVHPGESYVVTGWPIASEGRKHRAGSAIHDAAGRRVAVAESLWITLRG